MRYLLIITLLLSLTEANGQDTAILNKWKRAVVNLELRTSDTTGYYKYNKDQRIYRESLLRLAREGKITKNQFLDSSLACEVLNPRKGKKLSTGTAVFIKKDNRRYLVTARHVVYDASEAKWRLNYKVDSFKNFDLLYNPILIVPNFEYVKEDTSRYLGKIIVGTGTISGVSKNGAFKKNSYDYSEDTIASRIRLLGLNHFGIIGDTRKECFPYSFSDSTKDLAVLSLESKYGFYAGPLKYKNLGEFLESLGYVPLPYELISDEPSTEGQTIFTVGYPGSTSVIRQFKLTEYEELFSSRKNSLPVFSFGKVAMNSKYLDFFWADISVYPGNSGGPIIGDGKLIGIVSKQALVEGARIPFGEIIKAKHIKELIKVQEAKDICSGQTSIKN